MPELSAPQLEGWVTLTSLAADIGVSRQLLHYHAREFASLRRVGRSRPVYVVATAEVPAIRAALLQGKLTAPDARIPAIRRAQASAAVAALTQDERLILANAILAQAGNTMEQER